MGAYSLLKITISMSLACLPDSNKSISITKFFLTFRCQGVKPQGNRLYLCRLYHREVSRRCQEGVKEVSSRGLLADSLQEVVYDGLIGTE